MSVTYRRDGAAARIEMDDGKVNVMTPALLGELHSAFDRAEAEGAMVVLSSRRPVFSAGFDVKVFAAGDAAAGAGMVRAGAELALKVMGFPRPVVTVTAGHAFPMGAFLMLSADWRIGVEGDWRVGLNEVAIGLAVPHFALEVARQRLHPAYFSRTAVTGEMFGPAEARVAGFIDELVTPDAAEAAVQSALQRLGKIDEPSHAATKRRARAATLKAMRAAIDADYPLAAVA